MFYTPKPRQYHYKPRFYDPEREDWELLKAKYNLDENGNPRTPIEEKTATVANDQQATEDQDLE